MRTTAVSEYLRSIKEAEGGAWSTNELIERTGLSHLALQARRDAFAIIYWTDDGGQCHYPKWQFDSDLQVKRSIRDILLLLQTRDSLKVLTTFLVPSIGTPGVSPLNLIQSGKADEAVAQVRALVNER